MRLSHYKEKHTSKVTNYTKHLKTQNKYTFYMRALFVFFTEKYLASKYTYFTKEKVKITSIIHQKIKNTRFRDSRHYFVIAANAIRKEWL